MRLLTWNIHKGIGSLDRRYDPDRIVDVIAYYDPEILALQEVDDRVPRSRFHNQVDYLADRLGYHYRSFGPNVYLKQGCYGNATLSRFPITRQRNIDLTFGAKKARGGLYTEVRSQVNGHRLTLHMVNVHLGLSGIERHWQVRRLLESPDLTRLETNSRLLIVGDTNDWSGALARGRLRKENFLCATGTGRRASLTFPSWQPIGALDRVFARGAVEVEHHHRGRLDLARQASDHLPIVVELELTSF